MINDRELANCAIQARQGAYAPYSGFMVGAALLTAGWKVYTGVNIENAAYSPSNCAERTAFFKAVSEGERQFQAIAVAGWRKDAPAIRAYPCGVCRQVMMEFCDPESFRVIVVEPGGAYFATTLAELMPFSFGPTNVKNEPVNAYSFCI